MSLASLLATRQVTIYPYTAGAADAYGNIPGSWGPATATNGWIEQTSSTEQLDGRDRTVTTIRLFLATGTTVGPRDRVADDSGDLFEVNGIPDRPFTPRGQHHVVALLTRVVG